MALLALSAALVSASFAASRAIQLRIRAESSRLRIEAAAIRSAVKLLSSWGTPEDALAPGASLERDLPANPAMPQVSGRSRVTRLRDRTFLLTVDVHMGTAPELARRRLQLLLLRPTLDSASIARGDPPPPPRPVSTWSLADLY